MLGPCAPKESVYTPYGNLEGNALVAARELNLVFADKVGDSAPKDYQDARDLFADPDLYYRVVIS